MRDRLMQLIDVTTNAEGLGASTLVLEHALIMLLLLIGLLSVRSRWQRYVPWVIVVGAGLSLFTPTHAIPMAWPLLSFLLLPPLLWHISMQVPHVQFPRNSRHWGAWGLTVVCIAGALTLSGAIPAVSAVLLALIAASLMSQLHSSGTAQTGLSAFGQLTLAFLLVEIDVTAMSLRPIVANVIAGAGLGILIGFGTVRLALRNTRSDMRNLLCIAGVYVAYLAAIPIAVSSIVATFAAGLILAEYGYRAGVWPDRMSLPRPINTSWVFALMAGAFVGLGWQGHVDMTTTHAAVIGTGIVGGALGITGAYLLGVVPATRRGSFRAALIRQERKLLLLLFGTFLLWPQAVILAPWSQIVALVVTAIGLGFSFVIMHAVFDVLGVHVRRTKHAAFERIHLIEDRATKMIRVWRN